MRPSSPPSLEAAPPSGEPLDFAAVHRAYASYVRALVRARVPQRNADDLEQESFLQIYGALPSCDSTRALKPWIKTIVIRTIHQHRMRCSTRCELLLARTERAIGPDREDLFSVAVEDLHSSSEDLLGTRELLRELLAPLNERQQELLVRYMGEEEPIDEVAKDLQLSTNGGYSLLRLARVKLKAAVQRHEVRERRVLGGRSALLFPCGLALRPEAWLLRVRSALGRVFASFKAALASVVVSAGVVVVLGALAAPRLRPSVPGEKLSSPVAVNLPAAPAPKAVSRAVAKPPRPSAKSAGLPSPTVSSERDAAREHSSLERIRAMLKTDPSAALAAFKLHRKRFTHEQFRADREGIESMTLAKAR